MAEGLGCFRMFLVMFLPGADATERNTHLHVLDADLPQNLPGSEEQDEDVTGSGVAEAQADL